MPVFQTLQEAQTAYDALEIQHNAEVTARQTAETQLAAEQQAKQAVEAQLATEQAAKQAVEAELATEQAAKQAVEAQLVAEQQAKQEVETQLAQVQQEKAAVEIERAEATEGLATAQAKIEQMKTPDGFIETINKLPAQGKRELSIKARTTKEGIKAYVGFLYGVAPAKEFSEAQSGDSQEATPQNQ